LGIARPPLRQACMCLISGPREAPAKTSPSPPATRPVIFPQITPPASNDRPPDAAEIGAPVRLDYNSVDDGTGARELADYTYPQVSIMHGKLGPFMRSAVECLGPPRLPPSSPAFDIDAFLTLDIAFSRRRPGLRLTSIPNRASGWRVFQGAAVLSSHY